MKNIIHTYAGISIIGMSLLAASSVHATPMYTITDLGVLAGGSESRGHDVNNNGQVAGFTFMIEGLQSSLYDKGTTTNLGSLGGNYTLANGINNSGKITGKSSTQDARIRAFVYDSGSMSDIGDLLNSPYEEAEGFSINDSGQVAGVSGVGGYSHAFIYENGAMTDLGVLDGFQGSAAYDINENSQVTGMVERDIGGLRTEHAFLYDNGVMTDLGTLEGDRNSVGEGINAQGQVTGYSHNDYNDGRAFLSDNGQIFDLGTLGGDYSYGKSISDLGQVVGHSGTNGGQSAFIWTEEEGMLDLNTLVDVNDLLFGLFQLEFGFAISDNGRYITGYGSIDGEAHAFLLEDISVTAVPLPPAVWLFGAALAGLGFVARKKKLAA